MTNKTQLKCWYQDAQRLRRCGLVLAVLLCLCGFFCAGMGVLVFTSLEQQSLLLTIGWALAAGTLWSLALFVALLSTVLAHAIEIGLQSLHEHSEHTS